MGKSEYNTIESDADKVSIETYTGDSFGKNYARMHETPDAACILTAMFENLDVYLMAEKPKLHIQRMNQKR